MIHLSRLLSLQRFSVLQLMRPLNAKKPRTNNLTYTQGSKPIHMAGYCNVNKPGCQIFFYLTIHAQTFLRKKKTNTITWWHKCSLTNTLLHLDLAIIHLDTSFSSLMKLNQSPAYSPFHGIPQALIFNRFGKRFFGWFAFVLSVLILLEGETFLSNKGHCAKMIMNLDKINFIAILYRIMRFMNYLLQK